MEGGRKGGREEGGREGGRLTFSVWSLWIFPFQVKEEGANVESEGGRGRGREGGREGGRETDELARVKTTTRHASGCISFPLSLRPSLPPYLFVNQPLGTLREKRP
jgi:hypothetical protein